jgi:microcystin-dependent protein
MKQRIKLCNVCKIDFSTMYRVQYKNPKEWVFVCEGCLLKVKENNSAYKYGGTWKK